MRASPSLRAFSSLFAGVLLAASISSQTPLTTQRLIGTGLRNPLWAGAPDGDARIFIAQQNGIIKIYENGALLPTPFLTLGSGLVSSGGERGLLGVAFHPNFAQNGEFFLNYTRQPDGATVISRWRVSTSDPNVADPQSEEVILVQSQPFSNHNAGGLAFSPVDGFLYIPLGDGGSANDPGCRAQKLDTLLGKMVRIDVDGGTPYAIPPSNPYVGVPNAREEIFHLGLRNPYRFSFDRATGDIYIGDVGQNAREEIDFAAAGDVNLNFGWKVMEGTRCASTNNCPTVPACNDPAYTDPIYELIHGGINPPLAVTGGYVYRGCAIPDLVGTYFFSDYADDKIRTFEYDVATGTVNNFQDRTAELAPATGSIVRIAAFGEDGFGEILIVEHGTAGELYKVVAASAVQATALQRNGGGTNRVCLESQSQPILGSTWTVTIDASGAGGTTVGLFGFSAPSSGTFLFGEELLVDLSSQRVFSAIQALTGAGIEELTFTLPCDLSLGGVQVSTQAAVFGGGVELCNAVDVVLGSY